VALSELAPLLAALLPTTEVDGPDEVFEERLQPMATRAALERSIRSNGLPVFMKGSFQSISLLISQN